MYSLGRFVDFILLTRGVVIDTIYGQHAFRRRFGNALQWYQVLELRMKHEVNSWVQAIPSSHHDDVPMPTNISPLAGPLPTSHSASTQNSISRPQPSTLPASEVQNEEACPTIGEVEDTEDPRWYRTCPSKAFPLPSSDSVHTLDRHAREDRPSPYLTRRCPVCFSASGAKLDHSRYAIKISSGTCL